MINQNKKIYLALSFLLIIPITAALISCNDTPVTSKNKYIFDSPRYTWTADTITNAFFIDGWYYDTNKIFLVTGSCIAIYDGSVYTYHYFPSSFSPYCITGFDENNVYLGGSFLGPNNDNRAMLKKWTGGSFVDFSLDESLDQADNFYTVYSRSQNELWLSASKGRVYKFDGNNFETFNFDTNYWNITPFMKDELNNNYFAGKIFYGSFVVDSVLIELQKYNNSTWEKIYASVRHGRDINFFTQNIGSEIFGISDQQISRFNGSNFVLAISTDAFSLSDGMVSGPMVNSLTCRGYDFSLQTDCLFNWNGNKWSKELTFGGRGFIKIIYSDNERAYVIDYSYISGKTYFMKGKKK
jgi:hypothetical protein